VIIISTISTIISTIQEKKEEEIEFLETGWVMLGSRLNVELTLTVSLSPAEFDGFTACQKLDQSKIGGYLKGPMKYILPT
jgi:hypothetical protein